MILVTAATPWEFLPLASAFGLPRVRGLARGRWRGREVALLETGVGPAAARAALARLGAEPVELALSSGFAGALQPDAAPGDLAFDPNGARLEWVDAARRAAAAAGKPLHLGRVLSSESVLGPAAKRALGRERRALAVDMESAALRDWAAARGVETATLRVLFDSVEEELPGAPAGEGLRDLARFAAAHAGELPWLARLWWRQQVGMRSLGRALRAFLEEVSADAARA